MPTIRQVLALLVPAAAFTWWMLANPHRVGVREHGTGLALLLVGAALTAAYWARSELWRLGTGWHRDRLRAPHRVLVVGAIHCMPRAVRAHLVPRLRVITRGHRLHAHTVYFAPGELASLYAGWAILPREARVIDCHQDGSSSRARHIGPPGRRDEGGSPRAKPAPRDGPEAAALRGGVARHGLDAWAAAALGSITAVSGA